MQGEVNLGENIFLEGFYGPLGPEQTYLVGDYCTLSPSSHKHIIVKDALNLQTDHLQIFHMAMIFNTETGEMCGFLSDENETGELEINKSENGVWKIRN